MRADQYAAKANEVSAFLDGWLPSGDVVVSSAIGDSFWSWIAPTTRSTRMSGETDSYFPKGVKIYDTILGYKGTRALAGTVKGNWLWEDYSLETRWVSRTSPTGTKFKSYKVVKEEPFPMKKIIREARITAFHIPWDMYAYAANRGEERSLVFE